MAKRTFLSDEAAKAARDAAIKTAPDLCKSLVAIAAFNLDDNPEAQMKIYAAVKSLQALSQ